MAEEPNICYAVKDWNKHFENSESRKYKTLGWVPVKNKHDGKGYRRVAAHSKSIHVFCAWCLIVQVASKMPVRGILHDDDGPLTSADLADKTGYPQHIFEAAFKALSDPRIGWLRVLSSEELREHSEFSEFAGRNGNERQNKEQNGSSYSTLKGKGGAGERGAAEPRKAEGGSQKSALRHPASDLLSFAGIATTAAEIMGNDWGWCYDNCKVKLTDFTQAGLMTVLKPFQNRATEKQVRAAWLEAVRIAHQQCVDYGSPQSTVHSPQSDPVRSPAGLATSKFKELLNAELGARNAEGSGE